MPSDSTSRIRVRAASEHNLKALDLDLPRNALVVVTGVSGSGKSSLVFDTICREGQRRYLESFSSYARQFLGRLSRPAVARISGLSPAIAVDQKTVVRSARSTVGTLTGLYDHLRLLFARLGRSPEASLKLERSLFSFNSPAGACPGCSGLGIQDRIDPELLIADPSRTLREGALVPTTPSGYIVYSQITMEVLDQVCRAHGFSVDIPWRDLTPEQREVVLRGSDRLKIEIGKHTLESRLRWKGITAKPREEGYYKGLLTVMEQALKRARSPTILRFVRTLPCADCGGHRLRPEALSVRFRDRSIAELASLSLDELCAFFEGLQFLPPEAPVGAPLRRELLERAGLLSQLGLGYLTIARDSSTLSGGEAQRIRLATQAATELRGVLYVLDEPSIGLHARDARRLLELLRRLRDNGNSVLVVEHDEQAIRGADWLVDIGPGPGAAGGELLYSGPAPGLLQAAPEPVLDRSRTRAFFTGREQAEPSRHRPGTGALRVAKARRNNLRGIDAEFRVAALNVVTGVSGAGKSSLVEELLARHEAGSLEGGERIDKIIAIDQSPIGRTPRSNPATYTGLSDLVRDLFAASPEAAQRGFGKGRFSFNVKGGRCEACEGAGVQQVGMHFLGTFDVVCETCGGRRFNPETLEVRLRGRSIHDVLELSVGDALSFFSDQPRIVRILEALRDLGLGYLTLGQPSTTLSGGEAQRVKLAAELCRPGTGRTLYVLDEPTTGLHVADVQVLLRSLQRLADLGNTVVVIEHDLDVVRAADWVIDLGPESGAGGGQIVAAGAPEVIAACAASHTGAALRGEPAPEGITAGEGRSARAALAPIRLRGVRTHNLKGIDVDVPAGKFTVITGVSGSGKSSLAFDTIYAEGRNRFAESFSTFGRRLLERGGEADVEACSGISPAIAIRQRAPSRNPRSTVGTMTEVYDLYRLLWSRAGVAHCPTCRVALHEGACPGCGWRGRASHPASAFSFNDEHGACGRCRGIGQVRGCDPDRLISDPSRPLWGGAMNGHKAGRFYGDPDGQHMAILRAVGDALGFDLSLPWRELAPEAREVALRGAGDRTFAVEWNFRRGTREGTHRFEASWSGLLGYVNEEYERKHADHRGEALEPLMRDEVCGGCGGARLKPELRSVLFAGLGISELSARTVDETLAFFAALEADPAHHGVSPAAFATTSELRFDVVRRLRHLRDAGLAYLSIDRAASTLSGGEAQRVRLSASLGSGLTSVTYVLDEPTTGLHARDSEGLLALVRALRDEGNTVIVVEHDPDVIRAADHVIDLGPGPGELGGRIVAQGTPAEIANCPESVTGRHLATALGFGPTRPLDGSIEIAGARVHNLRDLDVRLPAGGLVAVTGVSGSGKSSLVFDVLAASADAGRPVGCRGIRGLDSFASVIRASQHTAAASSASTPATLVGAFDPIRELFARTEAARERGYKKTHFSLTAKGGRCEACEGAGRTRVSMDFLPDVFVPCEACGGRRYGAEALECTWRSRSIADVLELGVADAASFFADEPAIAVPLRGLAEVGLEYLRLGQPAQTLSGGELQRVRLAADLAGAASGRNLYLFDEPTTGLHPDDVSKLVRVFQRLVDAGHSVIAVEHNLQLIAAADWVIDLGPEGGPGGGQVVASGPPVEVAARETHTGRALKRSRWAVERG